MPSASDACGSSEEIVWPSSRISPPVIGARPEIAISVEVLPAPLEPMIAVISRCRAPRGRCRAEPGHGRRRPAGPRLKHAASSRPVTEIGLDHLRVALDVGGRALRDLLAEVEHRHDVGDAHDQLHVMLDHDLGHTGCFGCPG